MFIVKTDMQTRPAIRLMDEKIICIPSCSQRHFLLPDLLPGWQRVGFTFNRSQSKGNCVDSNGNKNAYLQRFYEAGSLFTPRWPWLVVTATRHNRLPGGQHVTVNYHNKHEITVIVE